MQFRDNPNGRAWIKTEKGTVIYDFSGFCPEDRKRAADNSNSGEYDEYPNSGNSSKCK
uniref:Uncharacterized protein n=1 Tax=uncultured Pseudomonadota bacterium TaxID=153809 RepID=A0A2P0QJG8_9PROT|nr:hypothetical protein [uncultured proteobacterium]